MALQSCSREEMDISGEDFHTLACTDEFTAVFSPKRLLYSGATLPRNYRKSALLNVQMDSSLTHVCVCTVHTDSCLTQAALKRGVSAALTTDVHPLRVSASSHRWTSLDDESAHTAYLHARLQYLKQALQEKLVEYKSLMNQEKRLLHSVSNGELFCSCVPPVPPEIDGSSTTARHGSLSTQRSNTDMIAHSHKCQSCSSRSKLTRSTSAHSHQRETWVSSQRGYSSLPRKSKQKLFSSRLWRFLPGLSRSLQEEGNHI